MHNIEIREHHARLMSEIRGLCNTAENLMNAATGMNPSAEIDEAAGDLRFAADQLHRIAAGLTTGRKPLSRISAKDRGMWSLKARGCSLARLCSLAATSWWMANARCSASRHRRAGIVETTTQKQAFGSHAPVMTSTNDWASNS